MNYVEVLGETQAALTAALNEFAKRVTRSRVLEDLRKHEQYTKPSVARRIKHDKALQTRRREARELKQRRRYEKHVV
jgi:ribosomal protein S21